MLEGFKIMIKRVLIILLFFFLSLVLFFKFKPLKFFFSKRSTIIILNGPSSSGKSSIAKKLEEKLFPQYFKIGADEFVLMLMPQKLFNFDPSKEQPYDDEALRFIKADDQLGPKLITKTGKSAAMIGCAMPTVIKALAQEGHNMIIDAGITTDLDWLKCFVKELKHFKVYFINITAPLEVLQQREKQRNGFIGLSRGQFETMKAHEDRYNITYDLVLDTSSHNPDELADQIINFISNNDHPKAFYKLDDIR